MLGVQNSQRTFRSGTAISTQTIWARNIERWTGIASPVRAERHAVLSP